ncbi:rho guanine nucleotide exchange factor 39 isoform X2 [Sphaerodactylus townsendi]|uniref:rho guanine nucleotide exchange factor 39 isoform X2 n=1 Tax=Sphaerodactylus townsendi TaxID=933632 RepID=UPI002026AF24|nr:rho guanine nucleotide exchange factor 39 isoform X2 [Sphaerodactylus townsendi]
MAAAGPDGRSCVHVAEQRARWERRRRRAAQELVGSEQRYLEQLDLVATFFVAILKAKGTLKPAVLEALFGPWESVCSASRTLVFHLERGHLALGLEGFRHQVVLYRHYAENFAQAKKTLQKQVRKNKSFVRFKKLQEARPEFKGSRLEDVLPLPLQRLPQRFSFSGFPSWACTSGPHPDAPHPRGPPFLQPQEPCRHRHRREQQPPPDGLTPILLSLC